MEGSFTDFINHRLSATTGIYNILQPSYSSFLVKGWKKLYIDYIILPPEHQMKAGGSACSRTIIIIRERRLHMWSRVSPQTETENRAMRNNNRAESAWVLLCDKCKAPIVKSARDIDKGVCPHAAENLLSLCWLRLFFPGERLYWNLQAPARSHR
jgi:hypothetical protein